MTDGKENRQNSPEPTSLTVRENVGVQPREEKYGEGENKRVFEIAYRGFFVGVNLGDIAQAPTEAVMCPTTPVLEVGEGGVENALYRAAGRETFDEYAHHLMQVLASIKRGNEQEQLQNAQALINLLQEKSALSVTATPEEIVADILSLTQEIQWDSDEKATQVAIKHGMAIAAPSGKLVERGIKTIILTNVFPEHEKMSRNDMVSFTYNTCMAALRTGVDSVTIPAVGTGFAAAYGFGLSQAETVGGFLDGVKLFIDEIAKNGPSTNLNRIDYNIYFPPTQENAEIVRQIFANNGAFEILKESHI